MALRSKRQWFEAAMLLSDLVVLEATLAVAYYLRYMHEASKGIYDFPYYASIGALAGGLWILVSTSSRFGYLRSGWRFTNIVSQLLFGYLTAGLIFLAGLYLTKFLYSRLILIGWAVLGFAAMIGVRFLWWHLLSRWKTTGRKKVLLVGSVNLVLEATAKIKNHPELLYELVGAYCFERETSGLGLSSKPESSTLVNAVDSITQKGIDEIFVLFSELPGPELISFLSACRNRNVVVRVLPYPYELYVSKVELSDLEGMPLLEIKGQGFPVWAIVAKRVLDVAVGTALVLTLSPVFFAIALTLALRGRMPIIRKEEMAGINGVPFQMFRFNTRSDSSAHLLERGLARLSLTELPQLFNVLIGHMSMVGPRPESMSRIRNYSEWQRRRLQVLPGITGLAQVNGLRRSDKTEAKVRYDLQYLAQWSPWNDAILLIETTWLLLGRLGRAGSARIENAAADTARTVLAEKVGS